MFQLWHRAEVKCDFRPKRPARSKKCLASIFLEGMSIKDIIETLRDKGWKFRVGKPTYCSFHKRFGENYM